MKENISLILSILFNAFVIGYVFLMFKNISTYFWPKTKGTIVKSEIEVRKDIDGDIFVPLIEYEYSINGNIYRNNQVSFGLTAYGKKPYSQKIINKFPINNTINVFYNPNKHNLAILLPGLRFHQLALLIIIVFIIYIWVPIGWQAWSWLLNL